MLWLLSNSKMVWPLCEPGSVPVEELAEVSFPLPSLRAQGVQGSLDHHPSTV